MHDEKQGLMAHGSVRSRQFAEKVSSIPVKQYDTIPAVAPLVGA